MYATIQKWGNSQGIRLPKHLLETLGLQENDQVEIAQERDLIVIRKAGARHKTLEERMAGFDGNYTFSEYDWGKPVGNEVL